MVATRIVQITSQALELELTEPFGISGGSQERAQIALVNVTLEDGTVGRGEAAPLPAYNGERVEGALAALDAARAGLLGADAASWRYRLRRIRGAPCRQGCSHRPRWPLCRHRLQ